MIKSSECKSCSHILICYKLIILKKFIENNKEFQNVNINLEDCRDYEKTK